MRRIDIEKSKTRMWHARRIKSCLERNMLYAFENVPNNKDENLKATVDMQIMLDNQGQSKQTQNQYRETSKQGSVY